MGFFARLKEKIQQKREEKAEKKQAKIVAKEEAKYIEGLSKSRGELSKKLEKIQKKSKKINSEYFEELEELLIESDIGVDYAFNIVERLTIISKQKKLEETSELNEELFEILHADYGKGDKVDPISFAQKGPTVFLIIGVNGVGKTTSIAKLANLYQEEGKKVLLVGADTFRAGAATQLSVWAERLNIDSMEGKLGSDPSSIIYDGLTKALNQSYDLVLIDVAGRLTTKTHLMDELGKINRVIKKRIPDAPHQTLLVLDANLGQNGISQAKIFKEVIPLTGIILTKMDGTSRGGIALQIKRQFALPIRFIGLGEKPTDLMEFNLDYYLNGLIGFSEEQGDADNG